MADFAETTGGGTALEESSLVGPGLTSASGEPIHAGGQGPHVVFDDGSHEWVRGWPVRGGGTMSLVDTGDGRFRYFDLDGTAIPDAAVAFEGTGRPEESKAEYFAELAAAEGWVREDWEALAPHWPSWERDIQGLLFLPE